MHASRSSLTWVTFRSLATYLPVLTFFVGLSFASAQEIFAIARDGSAAQIRASIAGGQDVNVRDQYGQTPLMYAAGHNTREAIETLVELGADLHARTPAGWDVTMYALRDNHRVDVLFALLNLGANFVNRPSGLPDGLPAWLHLAGQNPAFIRGGEYYREFHGFGKHILTGMFGLREFTQAPLFDIELPFPGDWFEPSHALRMKVDQIVARSGYRCEEFEGSFWHWGRHASFTIVATQKAVEFSMIEQGYDLTGLTFDLANITSRVGNPPEGHQFILEGNSLLGVGFWFTTQAQDGLMLILCTVPS